MAKPLTLSIIGAGLIGSSLARAIRHCENWHLRLYDTCDDVRAACRKLNLADIVDNELSTSISAADIIILATPVGTYSKLVESINEHAQPSAIISDVGSVKSMVAEVFGTLRADIRPVPAHPIAGTEKSGPENGFASLFQNRWCIITPINEDMDAREKIADIWRQAGSRIEYMAADRHDLVMAITSHIPHLVAFSTVGTANHLEQVTSSEVIKYSAGGFDSFTRLAGSDPIMWRDVFLNNKDAVLEMLARFTEDLIAVQRMIRFDDAEGLEDLFRETQKIRRELIDSGMGRLQT